MSQEIGKVTRITLEGFGMNNQCVLYKNFVLNFGPLEKDKEIHVFDIEAQRTQKIKLKETQETHEFKFVVHWKENRFVLTGGKEYIKEDQKYNKISIVSIIENQEKDGNILENTRLEFEIHTLEPQIGNLHPSHVQLDQDNLYFEIPDSYHFYYWSINYDKFEIKRLVDYAIDSNHLRVFEGKKSFLFVDFKKNERCSSCKQTVSPQEIKVYELAQDNSNIRSIFFANMFEFASENCSFQVRNGLIYFFSEKSEIWVFDTQREQMNKAKTVGEKLPYGPVVSAKYEDKILLWEEKKDNELLLLSLSETSSCEEQDSKNGKEALSSLEKLFEEKSFTDVIFLVEDQEIPAHKCILLQSTFFSNMFSSGMAEAQSNKIPIPGISVAAFQALLKFIYCRQVVLDDSLALELIVQADKFSLSALKSLCESQLKKSLKMNNLIQFAQVAEKVEAADLQNCIALFLARNSEKLEEEVNIAEIPPKLLVKALNISK